MFFSLFDKKLEKFNQPFFIPDEKTALVVIDREVQEHNSIIAKHPEDFILWKIGDFNDDSGVFTPDLVKVQDLAEVYHA